MIDVDLLQQPTPDGRTVLMYVLAGVAIISALGVAGSFLVGADSHDPYAKRDAEVADTVAGFAVVACVVSLFAIPATAAIGGPLLGQQQDDEAERVSKMIPEEVKADYRVTDVKASLTSEQVLAATTPSRLDAPKITVVTTDGIKAKVGVELDAKTGEATLISTHSSGLNPAKLAKHTKGGQA